METLLSKKSLVIKQKKEWGEILTGFETKNSYQIQFEDGTGDYRVIEESSFMARLFLRFLRPFSLRILDVNNKPILNLKRNFKWYYHEIQVLLPGGKCIGRIERQFSFLRRIYKVMNQFDEVQYTLFGPILKPWTFEIRLNDNVLGYIKKKWSGLLKESLTDADNFGISFPIDANVNQRALLLGAVFLIDFIHFENNNAR